MNTIAKTNVRSSTRRRRQPAVTGPIKSIRITADTMRDREFFAQIQEFTDGRDAVIQRLKAIHEAATDKEKKRALELAYRELEFANTSSDIARWWIKHQPQIAPVFVTSSILLMRLIRPSTPLNAAGGLGAVAYTAVDGVIDRIAFPKSIEKKVEKLKAERKKKIDEFLTLAKKGDKATKADKRRLDKIASESRALGAEYNALLQFEAEPEAEKTKKGREIA